MVQYWVNLRKQVEIAMSYFCELWITNFLNCLLASVGNIIGFSLEPTQKFAAHSLEHERKSDCIGDELDGIIIRTTSGITDLQFLLYSAMWRLSTKEDNWFAAKRMYFKTEKFGLDCFATGKPVFTESKLDRFESCVLFRLLSVCQVIFTKPYSLKYVSSNHSVANRYK